MEWPHQITADSSIWSEYGKGVRRQLLVMATGTGKTRTFARVYETAKAHGLMGQMMVLAHTDDLVKKNATVCAEVNPTANVGIEMAGSHADPLCDIISTSVQTLGRLGTKRVDNFDWANIDKIVVDEAHHSTADGYRRILEHAGVFAPDTRKLLLGVTATSQRSDGAALSDIYEKVVYVYPVRQAIKDERLVDIRGYRVRTDTSLEGISHSGGDFAKGELSTRINTEHRNRQIVQAWHKLGLEFRRTVAFCADIQHAKDLAGEFAKDGVSAEAVWGDDPDRDAKLGRHRDGTTKVLCNCQLLTEGYDDPLISCVILARPTESPIAFTQMVGRGTRVAEGKQDLVVIDVVDGTMRNSLITLPTLMGLPNGLDIHGEYLTEMAEEVESAQEEHPEVDWTKLEDVHDIQKLISAVDMFQVHFPKEVTSNSELTWFRAATGGYKMLIPKERESEPAGSIRIYENALGKWELDGVINGEPFHGLRPSFEEVIKTSDEQIRKRVFPKTLLMLKREAKWHNKEVTKGQRTMLSRLFPHKQFDFNQMKSGDASRLIAERLTRRAK